MNTVEYLWVLNIRIMYVVLCLKNYDVLHYHDVSNVYTYTRVNESSSKYIGSYI